MFNNAVDGVRDMVEDALTEILVRADSQRQNKPRASRAIGRPSSPRCLYGADPLIDMIFLLLLFFLLGLIS